jgi:hypothetical protein
MPRLLGKHSARIDPLAPYLRSLARVETPPEACNWWAGVGEWPQLANDRLGTCVPAAVLHHVQQRAQYAGRPVTITDDDCIALYSQWTGYTPTDPLTDRGTLVADALSRWLHRGFTLPDGTLSQIEAYAVIAGQSPFWVRYGIWKFGGVIVGLNCPSEWSLAEYLLDLPDGRMTHSDGGHCVLLVGYEPTWLGTQYDCITWGGRFRMTERAMQIVSDEAYCILDNDWLDPGGRDPSGIDWRSAQEAMSKLHVVT